MDKKEAFEKILKEQAEAITTWAKLYDYFAGQVKSASEAGPIAAGAVMLEMYAFITALRDLPEEGDISVLVERMYRNLLLDSEKAMGVEVTVFTKEELLGSLMKKADELRSALLPTSSPEIPTEKKTLH